MCVVVSGWSSILLQYIIYIAWAKDRALVGIQATCRWMEIDCTITTESEDQPSSHQTVPDGRDTRRQQ